MAKRRARRRAKKCRKATLTKNIGLLFTCWAVLAGQGWAQTAEQNQRRDPISSRLNPTGRDIRIQLPVRDTDRIVGTLLVGIGADDSISVSAEELVALLRDGVQEALLDQIRALADVSGDVRAERLAALGIILEFDSAAVELNMQLPSTATTPRNIAFMGGSQDPGPITRSPFFSAALNYRVGVDYRHIARDGNDGAQSPDADFDWLGRVGPVAFENSFYYEGDNDVGLARDSSRLIFDQPDKRLRWTLGDTRPQGAVYQSTSDVGGLSVSHSLYEFPSYGGAAARGRESFSIQRPSRVDLYVNGQLITQLRLRPGFYNLRDFPFSTGANDVEIIVEDDLGARQVLRFSYFLDSTLLAPGESEYFAVAGVPSELNDDGRSYVDDRPTVSGFYRRGINDRLTLGVSAQANDRARVVGLEVVTAPIKGVFVANIALSDIDDVGADYALRGDYRWNDRTANGGFRSFNVSAEARGQHFGSIESINPDNDIEFSIGANYSQTLSQSSTGNLSVFHQHSRSGDHRSSVGAGVSYLLSSRTQMIGSANYDFGGEEEGASFRLSLVHRFDSDRTGSATYDSRADSTSISYSNARQPGIGHWGGGGTLAHDPDGYSASVDANYMASRADLSISHSLETEDTEIMQERTSLRAAGALAYTNGAIAIGHAVPDSFVILKPHRSLHGAPIEVTDGMTNDVYAVSGPLGPALTSIGSYSRSIVSYDVPDAPTGYDLGEGTFTAVAPLHAGYAQTVGSDYNITLIGNLTNFAGEPVVLQSGEAVSLDNPDAPVVEVFTNRNGRFGASGISAGRWRVRTLTGEPLEYDIDVAPTDNLMVVVGVLRPNGSAGE